jgi:hypothetical protein
MPAVSLEAELGLKLLAYLDILGLRQELLFLLKVRGSFQELMVY